jgi:PASTA domain
LRQETSGMEIGLTGLNSSFRQGAAMKPRWLVHGAWLGVVMSTRLTAQSPNAPVTPIPQPIFRAMVAPQINLTPGALPIVQISIPLQAGQMARVFGRAEFFGDIATTSGAHGYNYASAMAKCLDPSGGNAGDWAVGQNYEGPTKAPGPSYPLTGHLVISPGTLITAKTTGPYTCQLLASTDKPTTVVGHAYEGDGTTWLRVSAPINTNDAQSWTTAKCTEGALPKSGGCPYLPPNPSESASLQPYVDVMSTSTSNPPPPAGSAVPADPVWSPPPDAAFVDVSDSMEISLCGNQPDSCPASWQSSNRFSLVATYVELVQLNAGNAVCQKADSPIQQVTINAAPHHYVIYHRLRAVPVYPACGSNQFQVRLYVKSVSGSPVVVDGAQAVAFTSYRGKGQAVPKVVGLAQSAAASALSAAGYVMNNVSSATNIAPVGSVTVQYPAAGVIELPGSGVDLTVSAGGVPVPNVLRSLEKNAIATLAAAGLNANVVSKPGCLDKEIVNAENPAANTVVSPHSSITITVNSGTTSSGKPCASD